MIPGQSGEVLKSKLMKVQKGHRRRGGRGRGGRGRGGASCFIIIISICSILCRKQSLVAWRCHTPALLAHGSRQS